MKYRYQSGDNVYELLLERTSTAAGNSYRVVIDGQTYTVEILDAQPGALALRFGPAEPPMNKHAERSDFPQEVTESKDAIRPQVVYWGAEGDTKWLSSGGCTYRLERPKERGRGRSRAGTVAAEDILRAPMPAQVRAVQVVEGDAVEAGQTLLLLEAMKMEIKLTSPRAAKVCRLLVKQGETVEKDQVLVELE